MNAVKVPEKLGERAAMDPLKVFAEIPLKDELRQETKEAARVLANNMYTLANLLKNIETGIEVDKSRAELNAVLGSMKSEISKISSSKHDSALNNLFKDFQKQIEKGENPFKKNDIEKLESHLLLTYGHSTYTVPEFGFSGLAEVTSKKQMEHSGTKVTIMKISMTESQCPPSSFYVLERGAQRKMFAEVISNDYENKLTVNLMLHLQKLAAGKEEPNIKLLFGHNRFLGMYTGIMPEKDYSKLDKAFVKEWMQALLAEGDNYKPEDVLKFSEEAQRKMKVDDPYLWARVQMLRHLKKGIDEISETGLTGDGLRKKLLETFERINEMHELNHAVNTIQKHRMSPWIDELSSTFSTTHGDSVDYPGAPHFILAMNLPLFAGAMDTLSGGKSRERILSLDALNALPKVLNQLDYGERAALLSVYALVKRLETGQTPELEKLGRDPSWNPNLDPPKVLELGTLDSFFIRQHAMEIKKSVYTA